MTPTTEAPWPDGPMVYPEPTTKAGREFVDSGRVCDGWGEEWDCTPDILTIEDEAAAQAVAAYAEQKRGEVEALPTAEMYDPGIPVSLGGYKAQVMEGTRILVDLSRVLALLADPAEPEPSE